MGSLLFGGEPIFYNRRRAGEREKTMPKVIQFTGQMFDYGVERFLPEKVTVVRTTTLDSRFMTSHGRYCIVADDRNFVTHVGIELGKAPRIYVEHELDWDFAFYDDPTLVAPEEGEGEGEGDENKKGEGDDGKQTEGNQGGDGEKDPLQPGEKDGEEPDGEGTETPGDSGGDGAGETDGGETTEPEGGDSDSGGEGAEEVTTIVTPPVPAEEITSKITITEDKVTVEPSEEEADDDDDLPFADEDATPEPTPEAKPEPKPAPKPKATPKKKKAGRKGKKS
jgi:hypothetical protein